MNAIMPETFKCLLCRDVAPFRCAADSVGVALMTAHLAEAHNIEGLRSVPVNQGWVKPLPEISDWRALDDR